MALPDVTPSRLGQANGADGTDVLFIEKYAGEVLTAFRNATKFISKHRMRSVEGTYAAQFPIFGTGQSEYHTPGTMIDPSIVKHNEKLIAVDDLLIAPRFIARIDELKNHYEVRSLYSNDAGRTLALQLDSHIAQVGVLAARSAALIDGGPAGDVLENVDGNVTDPEDDSGIVAALFNAQVIMDEKNVPENGRYAFMRPAQFAKIIRGLTPIDQDYDGDGSIAKGKVYELAGFQLVKTNQLPSTNITTGPTAYRGDFSTTLALCMQEEAVGTVKLMDLQAAMEWSEWHQGTLLVAKYAMGHGILRPECSVEINSSTEP